MTHTVDTIWQYRGPIQLTFNDGPTIDTWADLQTTVEPRKYGIEGVVYAVPGPRAWAGVVEVPADFTFSFEPVAITIPGRRQGIASIEHVHQPAGASLLRVYVTGIDVPPYGPEEGEAP